ncbi:hypothetical protein [Azospirillum sp. INR13]|uniref:hypothetical protein n=1 Tax=Azospirillum sp. INR13 TaxID=2596919 RepID=UPI0021084960|nr:hypothetical protein [Azospirillum sp. INR13]
MLTIGFLVFDDFQVMGLAALSAFEMANFVLGRPAYQVHVLSEQGGPVRNSLGFAVETRPFGNGFFDTTVTIGSLRVKPSTPGLLAYLREAAGEPRRVAGICTGACRQGGGAQAGGLSAPARRTVAILRPAGSGAAVRPRAAGAGPCQGEP